MRTFVGLGNCSCTALPPASILSLKMNKNPAQFGYIHSWKAPKKMMVDHHLKKALLKARLN